MNHEGCDRVVQLLFIRLPFTPAALQNNDDDSYNSTRDSPGDTGPKRIPKGIHLGNLPDQGVALRYTRRRADAIDLRLPVPAQPHIEAGTAAAGAEVR